MNEKKINRILIVTISILIVAISAVSYAIWTSFQKQSEPNKVATGCFNIQLNEESESIQLNNTFPMTDEDGLKLSPYTFSVENTCSVVATYQINIEVLENNTLSANYIKLALNEEAPLLLSRLDTTDPTIAGAIAYHLRNGQLKPGESVRHKIRLWMDENTPTTEENKSIYTKISVSSVAMGEIYADASGANYPVLETGLIPVVYNEKTKEWVKADLYKKWYDYDKQMWANAVTVTESTREKYETAAVETPIKMEDINFMWVWIPRFEFRTDNLGTPSEKKYAGGTQKLPGGITINFIPKSVTTPSADNYAIHNAFWWDDNNNQTQEADESLSGIWIAKFEVSPDIECEQIQHAVGTGCDTTTISPKSIPNVESWVTARTGTFWTAIHNNMNGTVGEKTYGLVSSKNYEPDAHMVKNIEWGAMAYLTQSKYGRYGNDAYEGTSKNLEQNRCDKTGMATPNGAATSDECARNTYDTRAGQTASTTGNIYGIYDARDGAIEYVMGIMKSRTSNEPCIGYNYTYNSGWTGKYCYNSGTYTGTFGALKDIELKYYDLYEYHGNNWTYEGYHLGDAVYETLLWYAHENDKPLALSEHYGISLRSLEESIFDFHADYGYAVEWTSTRATLIQKTK